MEEEERMWTDKRSKSNEKERTKEKEEGMAQSSKKAQNVYPFPTLSRKIPCNEWYGLYALLHCLTNTASIYQRFNC